MIFSLPNDMVFTCPCDDHWLEVDSETESIASDSGFCEEEQRPFFQPKTTLPSKYSSRDRKDHGMDVQKLPKIAEN